MSFPRPLNGDSHQNNVVGSNDQPPSDLVDALRAVNDAFSIAGSQWDEPLGRVMDSLGLPPSNRKKKFRKAEAQGSEANPPANSHVDDVDSIKLASSLILFSSTSHLSNLSGTSRLKIDQLIRHTAVLASQSDSDALRTAIGKSQSRLVKKTRNGDLSSVSMCIGTFIKILASTRDMEILMSNGSIQSALIDTLSLMNENPIQSTKIASITKLALSSSALRSTLVSALEKQNSSRSISSILIHLNASMVEAVHRSDRRELLTRSDPLRSTAQYKGLSAKDVTNSFVSLQNAWTVSVSLCSLFYECYDASLSCIGARCILYFSVATFGLF